METATFQPELQEQIVDLINKCIATVKAQRPISVDNLVNEAKAAEILGLAKGTLAVWRHEGKGPKYFKLESAVRYDCQDLYEYAKQRSVQAGV